MSVVAVKVLLFTDIESSSTFWDVEPEAMSQALEQHDLLAHRTIAAAGGTIFKSLGDGICAIFDSVDDAIRAAVQFQHDIAQANWPTSAPLCVRTAVHCGGVMPRGQDYFGPPLNETARVIGHASAGQILVTETAAGLARALGEYELSSIGKAELRGIRRHLELFQVVGPGLIRMDARPGLSRDQNNLPTTNDDFVGRFEESAQVQSLLSRSHLVTVLGPGGIGKSRFLIELGYRVAHAFNDGLWWVELSELSPGESIEFQIANAIREPASPADTLHDRLTQRLKIGKQLLILDNAEHISKDVAAAIKTLRDRCPNLRILVTSRSPLHVPGEQRFLLGPLSSLSPNEIDNFSDGLPSESVKLFEQRAKLVDPSFVISARNWKAVAQLCLLADGVPLALELIAARTATQGLETILERIQGRLAALRKAEGNDTDRQSSIAATLDYSLSLLSEQERFLFTRLAAFAGSWTLEAAERVTALPPLETDDIEVAHGRLVEASLIAFVSNQNRYRMLVPIRAYARDLLQKCADCEAIAVAHTQWVAEFAGQAGGHLQGANQQQWFDRVDQELPNIRLALSTTEDANSMVRIASALHRYFWSRGHHRDAIAWSIRGLRQADLDPKEMASAWNALGILQLGIAEYAEAQESYESAIALYEQIGDQLGRAKCLANLASIRAELGYPHEAETLNIQAIELLEQMGDMPNATRIRINLGVDMADEGRNEEASEMLAKGAEFLRTEGDLMSLASALTNLARTEFTLGRPSNALELLLEAIQIRRKLGDNRIVLCLALGAMFAAELGAAQTAQSIAASVQAQCELQSISLSPFYRDCVAIALASTNNDHPHNSQLEAVWRAAQQISGAHDSSSVAMRADM